MQRVIYIETASELLKCAEKVRNPEVDYPELPAGAYLKISRNFDRIKLMDAPGFVLSDKIHIEQILEALASNANLNLQLCQI